MGLKVLSNLVIVSFTTHTIHVHLCKSKSCPPCSVREVCFSTKIYEESLNYFTKSCDDFILFYFFFASKDRLSEKSAVNKQQIHLKLVNIALEKLTNINPKVTDKLKER